MKEDASIPPLPPALPGDIGDTGQRCYFPNPGVTVTELRNPYTSVQRHFRL